MKKEDWKTFHLAWPAVVSLLFLSLIYLLHSAGSNTISLISSGIILMFLFLAAFFTESRYLPFLGVLPNLFLLYALVLSSSEPTPLILNVYLYAGIIFGLLTYLLNRVKDLKGNLYQGTFILYSIKTLFPIYLSYYLFGTFTHPFIIFSFVFFAMISWAFYLYIEA
jgi:hypothetical protein